MFSAASCGLTLLCDEALRTDLSAYEELDPPSPGERRSLSQRAPKDDKVKFDVRSLHFKPIDSLATEAVTRLEEDAAQLATLLIPDDSPEERRYERRLDAQLQLAYFNQQRNTKVFRYGEPSPITHKKCKTKDGTLPGCTQIHRRGGAPQAAGHHASSPQVPVSYILDLANEAEDAADNGPRS